MVTNKMDASQFKLDFVQELMREGVSMCESWESLIEYLRDNPIFNDGETGAQAAQDWLDAAAEATGWIDPASHHY